MPALRHREVPGQQVEQRRDVGRSLDARVPAQRENAAAGPAHVAEQQLDDRRTADVLNTDGMLRPADRIHPCRGALATAVRGDRLAHLGELFRGHAADPLHHLRRVPSVVSLENLKDAEGVFAGSRRGGPRCAAARRRAHRTPAPPRHGARVAASRPLLATRRLPRSPCPHTPSWSCRTCPSWGRTPRTDRPS